MVQASRLPHHTIHSSLERYDSTYCLKSILLLSAGLPYGDCHVPSVHITPLAKECAIYSLFKIMSWWSGLMSLISFPWQFSADQGSKEKYFLGLLDIEARLRCLEQYHYLGSLNTEFLLVFWGCFSGWGFFVVALGFGGFAFFFAHAA